MNDNKNEIALLKSFIKDANNQYLNYHSKRYEKLIALIKKNFVANNKILDIGNSQFAEIVSTLFKCKVDELGFVKDSIKPFGKQYQFDLNDSYDPKLWRKDIGPYDIIIFAEVIEHLYTSPNQVLRFLSSLLQANGKLILQTPNAAVLHKRFQLLLGKNPYMLIRENKFNPGHFREYTKKELVKFAQDGGFEIEYVKYGNYFDYQYTPTQGLNNSKNSYLKLVNIFYSCLPGMFKPGITMVLNKK